MRAPGPPVPAASDRALLARGTAGIIAGTPAAPDVEAVDLMPAVYRRLTGGDTMAARCTGHGSAGTEDPGSFVNWCTFDARRAA